MRKLLRSFVRSLAFDAALIAGGGLLVLAEGIALAHAGDMTITVPDTFKTTMQQTQITLERCMGAIVAKGETATCQAVQNMLAQLGALPETPVVAPAPPAAPPTVAPPEAQKKTEGDAPGK